MRFSTYLTFSIHLDGNKQRHDESVCQEGAFEARSPPWKLARDKGFRGAGELLRIVVSTGEDPTTTWLKFSPPRWRWGSGWNRRRSLLEYSYRPLARGQDVFLGTQCQQPSCSARLPPRPPACGEARLVVQSFGTVLGLPRRQSNLPVHAMEQSNLQHFRLAKALLPVVGRRLCAELQSAHRGYRVGKVRRRQESALRQLHGALWARRGTAVNDAFSNPIAGTIGVAAQGPLLAGHDGFIRVRRSFEHTARLRRMRSYGRNHGHPAQRHQAREPRPVSDAADQRIRREDESEDFGAQLEAWRARMESALAARLPPADAVPARLARGHALQRSGEAAKRIRPALVFATARAVGLSEDDVEAAACAIELVHVYSLVHDDLPAMDNDDMRRGRPTCHKAFDEATALLVGDALQPLAFQLLARDAKLTASPAVRLRLIDILAQAIGTFGMAGGQAIDLSVKGHATGRLARSRTCMRARPAP